MAAQITRVDDTGVGVCPAHAVPLIYTTVFKTGADTVFIDGKQACIIGTEGASTCGHPTVATSGSSVCSANGEFYHRVGDQGQNFGIYTVNTGSPNVTSE